MRESEAKGAKVELAAKCWDLASAYKQVPLSDATFELGSYLVVFNPHLGKPEVYQQKVLPFGSIASVTAFLRCALAIWHIGSVLLAFTWTPYFDDFLTICDERAVRHVEVCNSLFFQLLGWKLSKDKLVPYETCCKVLGVELDLTRSPAGVASLYNTAARRERNSRVTSSTFCWKGNWRSRKPSALEGDCNLLRTIFSGNVSETAWKDLSTHINLGVAALSDELLESLETMGQLIEAKKPRLVDTRFFRAGASLRGRILRARQTLRHRRLAAWLPRQMLGLFRCAHNLSTHNLLTYNLLHTQLVHTQLTYTQLVHTQLTHTQLVHTQLVHTQLVHTQLTHAYFAWQAWHLVTSTLGQKAKNSAGGGGEQTDLRNQPTRRNGPDQNSART